MSKFLKLVPVAVFILLAASTLTSEWRPDLSLQELLSGPLFWRVSILLVLLALVYYGWGFVRRVEASQKYRRAEEVLEEARKKAENEKDAASQLRKKIETECQRKLAEKQRELERETVKLKEYIKTIEHQNLELKATVGRLMRLLKKKKSE